MYWNHIRRVGRSGAVVEFEVGQGFLIGFTATGVIGFVAWVIHHVAEIFQNIG